MNGLWNRLKHRIGNMKLRQKLLISYLFLVMLSVLTQTLISNYRVANAMENQITFSARQSCDQSADFITQTLKYIVNLSHVILTDQGINDAISKDNENLGVYDRMQLMLDLSSNIRLYQNSIDIQSVKLYLPSSMNLSGETGNILSLESVKNKDWFERLLDRQQVPVWVDGLEDLQPNSISAVWPIVSFNDYMRQIGLLRIDVNKNTLQSIIKKAASTHNSMVYIINSNGEIIVSSLDNLPQKWIIGNDEIRSITSEGNYFGTHIVGGDRVLLGCKEIPYTDWHAIYITQYSEILTVSRRVGNELLVVMLVIVTFAYCLALWLSKFITHRLHQLTDHMKDIERGNFESVVNPGFDDEIGNLMDNFNIMSRKLNLLLTERIRIEKELKNSELRMLQAQINPHFLYNTLDLINWKAIDSGIEEISDTVRSLSRFYKLSLNNGSNTITIGNEIEHVKIYMHIQNRRFDNAFDFIVEMDESISDLTVIKMILQPLVENAIIHGILCKDEKRGKIKLTATREREDILLRVLDDGVGMNDETVRSILSDSNTDDSHGYGVKNVNQRISLEYGMNYGLTFQSAPMEGTTATVRIPAIESKQNDPS